MLCRWQWCTFTFTHKHINTPIIAKTYCKIRKRKTGTTDPHIHIMFRIK